MSKIPEFLKDEYPRNEREEYAHQAYDPHRLTYENLKKEF